MASAWQMFIVSSFAYLNLFMLENLSYKFDSLGMIISLGMFILLFSLPDNSIGKRNVFIFSSVAVFLSLSIYQVSVGAYISLALIESMYFLYRNFAWRDIMTRIYLRVLGILTGGLAYKYAIVNRYIAQEGYAAEHSSFLNPFSNDGVFILASNLGAFRNMLRDYGLTLGALGVIILLALCIGLAGFARYIWMNRKDAFSVKILAVLFLMFSPIFLLMASISFLVMLRSPVIEPRVMLSVSIFTLFIGLVLHNFSKSFGWLGEKTFLVLGIFTLVSMLSFSSYYGNLLTRQEKMNFLVANLLIHDINEIEQAAGQKTENLAFVGHSPECWELLLANRKRPLYNRLIPIYMNNDWCWGGVYLLHFKRSPIKLEPEADDRDYVKNSEPVTANEYYEIYRRRDKLIVKFMGV